MEQRDGMRVVSVNVGEPREVEWKGKTVVTAIFKEPVTGPIPLRRLNLAGDRQADLSVHGGPEKAVYLYPAAHYSYWREQLPDQPLPWGAFGENLTVEGSLAELDESAVHIGDRFRVGTAELMVTQPRLPCYKLGIRFGRDDMLKHFLASGRTGFYLSVLREGEVAAGDAIAALGRAEHEVTVAEIVRLYTRGRDDLDGLRRAVAVDALAAVWRDFFGERIAALLAHQPLDGSATKR